jgi:hypothetical protein
MILSNRKIAERLSDSELIPTSVILSELKKDSKYAFSENYFYLAL